MIVSRLPAGVRAFRQQAAVEPRSRLEGAWLKGRFIVTAEITSPPDADGALRRAAEVLRDWVDAANVTDHASTTIPMSSWAASMTVLGAGVEPVLQLQCRGRHRLALQADLLGAGAVGIPNVLLDGDELGEGDDPVSEAAGDFHSVQLVGMATTLREEARLLSDHLTTTPPDWLVGAVEDPFALPLGLAARRLAKKVAAGAEFVQTRPVFDLEAFARFMREVVDMGLTDHCAVLAGVGPILSQQALELRRHGAAAEAVADDVARRLQKRSAARTEEEGLALCAETIERVRSVPGVAGVHVVAPGVETEIPALLARAGVPPRERTGLAAPSREPS